MKDFILYCMCNFEYEEFLGMGFEDLVKNYIDNIDREGEVSSRGVKMLNYDVFKNGNILLEELKKYEDYLKKMEKMEK